MFTEINDNNRRWKSEKREVEEEQGWSHVPNIQYIYIPVRKNQNAKCKRKATAITDNMFYKFIL